MPLTSTDGEKNQVDRQEATFFLFLSNVHNTVLQSSSVTSEPRMTEERLVLHKGQKPHHILWEATSQSLTVMNL